MDGIQIVRLLDVMKVNAFRNAPGVKPRSLIVDGQDFSSIEQVLMNGFASPEFVTYSPTQLIAQVPEAIQDAIISDVAVLSGGLTLTERSLVEFTFGTRPKSVSGILRLMQTFLRILLRTPGSNRFHPRSGGGMLKRVGSNATDKTAADIAIAVSTARAYLINVQTSDRNIPPSERLLSAEIQNLTVDPSQTSAFVTIVLTNHTGRRGAATLQT